MRIVLGLLLAITLSYAFADTKTTGHIVLITSPFYGHMIPLLDLAKRLCAHHHITFITSTSKLDMLERRGFVHNDTSVESNLALIGLDDGNSEDYEATDFAAINQIQLILDRMREPLVRLLVPLLTKSTRRVDLIISDLFILPPVWEGHKHGVSTYLFVPNNLMAYMRYINISVEKINNGELGLDFDKMLHKTIGLAKGLICNSMRKFDKSSLQELRRLAVPGSNKPILFVAPLMTDALAEQKSDDVATIQHWLDQQWKKQHRSASVIYVSFGSWAFIQPKQVEAIVRGLKRYSFIWSLKDNLQASILPSWIDADRHLLVRWAPQRLILSHPAVRLFLSHGGWNSLLEGMLAGKPTLVWPIFGDQIINGQRLEQELGMGRCLPYTDLSNGQRLVSSEELARHVQGMFEQEDVYVDKAKEVQRMMQRARENSSRVDLHKISVIVEDQMMMKTNRRKEL